MDCGSSAASAILACQVGSLHLYSLDAIGFAIASLAANCSFHMAAPTSCEAACDTTDLPQPHPDLGLQPSVDEVDLEGYSVAQWVAFARKKQKIASSICRAHGLLKAQHGRKVSVDHPAVPAAPDPWFNANFSAPLTPVLSNDAWASWRPITASCSR